MEYVEKLQLNVQQKQDTVNELYRSGERIPSNILREKKSNHNEINHNIMRKSYEKPNNKNTFNSLAL